MSDTIHRMATMVLFRGRELDRSRGSRGLAPHLMTRTCMKVGVVDHQWEPAEGGAIPNPEEWWIVHIVHETNPGRNRGCFIMRPIHQVSIGSINPIMPGLYDSNSPNPGTLIVQPSYDSHGNWFMPVKLKRGLALAHGYSSIVVNLGGDYWGHGKAMWTTPSIVSP